jgi:hypothetical protein
VKSHNICHLKFVLFHLVGLQDSSVSCHPSEFHAFKRLSNIPLCAYTTSSSIHGHLSHFHFLTIVENAAVYQYLSETLLSILRVIYLGVELLIVVYVSVLPNCLLQMLCHLTSSSALAFSFPHILTSTGYYLSFISATVVGVM